MPRRRWLSLGCLLAAGVASATGLGCRSSEQGLPVDTMRGTGGRPKPGTGGMVTTPGTGGDPTGGNGTGGMGAPDLAPEVPPDVPLPEVAPEAQPEMNVIPPPPDMAPPPDTARPPWKPPVGATWDWQRALPINGMVAADALVVELFETPEAAITDLRGRNKKVICRVDLGTFERSRPDADKFPEEVLGAQYKTEVGRQWIDIRNPMLLQTMYRSRLDRAKAKGCDGVAIDNLDAFDTTAHEASGFPTNYLDQLIYNRTVATEARLRGLAVGLMNNPRQSRDLASEFDFNLSERCFERRTCEMLMPFISANKPVFDVEFVALSTDFCNRAKAQKISVIRKMPALDGYRMMCM